MSYLYCEKCGGYYELGDGESPEDFEECHCGGNLSFLEEIEDSGETEENNPSDEYLNPYYGPHISSSGNSL